MVIYDHTTNTARNIQDPLDPNCYTHGVMHHLGPFKNHKGLLLILPSKIYGEGEKFTEDSTGGYVREIGMLVSPQAFETNLYISTILLKSNSTTLIMIHFIPKKQIGRIAIGHYHGPDSVQY